MLIQSILSDSTNNYRITPEESSRSATIEVIKFTIDLGANGTATYNFVVNVNDTWSQIRKFLSDTGPF